MNKRMKMTVNRLLSGALVLLGFASCSDKEGEDFPLEYGTPSVRYQVKGRVTDANAAGVEGIQIVVRTSSSRLRQDTLYTDANGEFTGKDSGGISLGDIRVFYNDIDGDDHGGTFESDSIDIEKMEVKKVEDGNGHWYQGKYELTANRSLKLNKEKTPSEK